MQISDIQRHDSKKMYEAYDRWPEISQENYFFKDLPKIQFKNRKFFKKISFNNIN